MVAVSPCTVDISVVSACVAQAFDFHIFPWKVVVDRSLLLQSKKVSIASDALSQNLDKIKILEPVFLIEMIVSHEYSNTIISDINSKARKGTIVNIILTLMTNES